MSKHDGSNSLISLCGRTMWAEEDNKSKQHCSYTEKLFNEGLAALSRNQTDQAKLKLQTAAKHGHTKSKAYRELLVDAHAANKVALWTDIILSAEGLLDETLIEQNFVEAGLIDDVLEEASWVIKDDVSGE